MDSEAPLPRSLFVPFAFALRGGLEQVALILSFSLRPLSKRGHQLWVIDFLGFRQFQQLGDRRALRQTVSKVVHPGVVLLPFRHLGKHNFENIQHHQAYRRELPCEISHRLINRVLVGDPRLFAIYDKEGDKLRN